MNDQLRDVIIIGSGPAGYTAAIYAARAGLAPLVLEGSLDAGGALMTTTEVENFPGFPEGIQGPDLMENMRNQAERFGTEFITDDAVEVDLTGEVKTVKDGAGTVHRGRTVILATGSGYRHLGIPAEQTYAGKGLSWCATCDGFFFRGKDIAVVGGGDAALEEATFLTRFADKVTLIHRRDQLRGSDIMARRAKENPKIDFAWNSTVIDMHGDGKLESVTLQGTTDGSTRELPVEGLFEAIGSVPRSELFKDQVRTDDAGYVIVDGSSTRTSQPGVFACGDLVDHVYQQAISAAGTGCRAALDAEHYLASLND